MFTLEKSLLAKAEKASAQFYKIMKKSLKLKSEPLLIICDYGNVESKVAPMLGYAYYHGAQKKKHHVDLLFQETKKGFMQADDHIRQALLALPQKSVVIVAVSNKLGRLGTEKSFRGFCKEKQHRFLSATGLHDLRTIHFDILVESMNVNYSRLKKKGLQIKKKWDAAKEIRITTKAGTNVTFIVTGKKAIANIGEYHQLGEGGNMPAGEVYMPPEGYHGVYGKVVLDGSMKTDEGAVLLDEPVTLIIEKGRIVSITGKYAYLLEKTLQKYEDRAKYPYRVRHIGELGVGINPGAVLVGSTIIDEKVLGTAHIAIGSNAWFGGDIKTIFHGDQVFKDPTIYVDGKKMEL